MIDGKKIISGLSVEILHEDQVSYYLLKVDIMIIRHNVSNELYSHLELDKYNSFQVDRYTP